MAEEDGFFSRWSRRKVEARVVAEVPAPVEPPAPVALPAVETAEAPAAEPPPTLEDTQDLTPASDFTRFVAPDVTPEVKSAALKKLFADPHFNVMDGLDTYIDDYGKPDPLPAGWLRQMVQSQALGLFAEEQAQAQPPKTPPSLPVPAEAAADPPPEAPADENPDLQLQPDDVAGRAGLAPGPGEDAGRAH